MAEHGIRYRILGLLLAIALLAGIVTFAAAEPEAEEDTGMTTLQAMIAELPPAAYDEAREGVVYPSFQKYTYHSRTAGRDSRVNVLLPAGYTEERKYPVLYILHGFYDNEDWMAREVVGLSRILTNLQLDGQAEEMIVVLPYIFCSPDMAWCTGMDLKNCLAYDNFMEDTSYWLSRTLYGTKA